MKWPLVHQREGENPWVTYAKQQMFKKNCSLNLVATGAPGVGKSWATLSYLSMVDPTFNIERCFFKASKVLNEIKDGDLKRGNALLYDECGVDLNNLAWQNEINRGLNLVFQTLRFRNLTVALTLPHLNFLSKGVRTLMTSRFKIQGWSKKNNTTTIKPQTMEFNGEVDKFYYKRLLVKPLNGRPVGYCDFIKLPPPPKDLVKEYEKLKKEYTDSLYSNIGARIEEFERKAAEPISQIKLSEGQKEVLKYLREKKTVQQIADKRECNLSTVYDILNALKKKGVVIKPIRNKGKSIKCYEIVSGDVI